MLTTSEFSLPADDLGPLGNAFDMIGRHRFGPRWTKDMAMAVRLGQRSRDREKRARANWALKALNQSVENGWLPLVYFKGSRRIRYADAPESPALYALYPQPSDKLDGQIELKDHGIYPCMVDTSGFAEVLRRKFPKPAANCAGQAPDEPVLQIPSDRGDQHEPTAQSPGIETSSPASRLDYMREPTHAAVSRNLRRGIFDPCTSRSTKKRRRETRASSNSFNTGWIRNGPLP